MILPHDSQIFNIHDLVVLMAAGQCILLSILLFLTRRNADHGAIVLIYILLIYALQSIDTLFTWNSTARQLLLAYNSNLFFLGSFSYWLEGPLLVWYVKTVLYRDFHLRKLDLLHLIPLFVFSALLINQFHLLPANEQRSEMHNLAFMWTPFMRLFISLWHISVIAYGAWCLFILADYRHKLHQHYANIEERERRWLFWIVQGFMAISAWRLFVHLADNWLGASLGNTLGIISNYLTYLFVNSLVFVCIRYSNLFGVLGKVEISNSDNIQFKEEHIRRIKLFMETQKPYLDSDIHIESLAKKLSIPERMLSRILNQHFGKNFFEFINEYRINDAKQLLLDPKNLDRPILDILYEAGFTSKSTFNAIFKKNLGLTPSQFRTLNQK